MATITREKVACVIFGAPHEIPTNVLPTYADVMKAYINTRQQLTTKNNKYPPFAEVSNKVCVDVELVWEKASLPTVTHGRVIETLRSYNEKYKKILKPYKARKGNDKYKQQLEQFREDSDKLFDISKCKCVDFLMSCKCKRADKVPLSERDFLVDQRGARKMIIGGIDLMDTKRLQKKISRKESESRRHSDSIQQEQSKQQCNSRSYNVEDKDDDTDTSDEDDTLSKSHCKHDLPTPESKRQKMAMTVRLPSLPLPHVDVKDLSTDQQYLWQMCQAVSKGHCPCDLALRKPGLMNHSRWLTTANRILRLYVGLDTPSNNIKTLVTFIIRVYAPTWFAIKTQPSCKDGAKHLHGMMVRTRYLSSSLKKVIDPVIQRNGFCGHPENVLLAMITDE
ncbi:uncharacterized protein LOC126994856 [Eriocheir sinensis]|uniref:uncharacterized protein LOC126994856 n=1 Tax=Eriocheir sinensis TaxID=95602 RepID=UPI0021C8CB5B|nr:uncharacterized protein LOC126994856 [Eriocheir sinensis]